MTGLVVVGGGIAGLETALRLERNFDTEIKLVEPREKMLFYPSLHKIIEGEKPGKTTINYQNKLEKRNIKHVKTGMKDLEVENNTVILEDQELSYDKLVLAFGVSNNFHGVKGSEVCTLRSMEDVKEVRRQIEDGIEKAVVVGGGATGVEATASLLQARKEHSFEIELVHAEENLLPRNLQGLSKSAEKRFEEVNVRKETKAVNVKDGEVELSSGEILNADLVIWSAGLKNHELAEKIELPLEKKGIPVNNEMSVEETNDIYAVGDLCHYGGKENRAYYALSEAKTAVKNIIADLNGGKRVENSFFWDPQVIYLGGRTSGMQAFGKTHTGYIPHFVREYFVDQRYMLLRKHVL